MYSKQTPLSPIDLVFSGANSYSVEFLFKFDYLIDEVILRKALNKACSVFYPVGSTLAEDKDSTLKFKLNSESLDFRVIKLNKSPNFNAPNELAELSTKIESVPGSSLANFILAQTPQGSVLGVHISHCVVDGYSFFYFMCLLSEFYMQCSQGKRPLLIIKNLIRSFYLKPQLDRAILCKKSSDLISSKHLSTVDKDDLFNRAGIFYGPTRKSYDIANVKWSFIDISNKEVLDMLSKASEKSNLRLSKHDIITAYLWQKIASSWDHKGDDLYCSNAFDYRRILNGLTPKYFGNAIRCASVKLPKSFVSTAPIHELATHIRNTIADINHDSAEDSLLCLDEIRQNLGLEAFSKLHVSDLEAGFLVTNLSRVPLKSLNFGNGAPTEVVSITPAPRSAMVLSTQDGFRIRLQEH